MTEIDALRIIYDSQKLQAILRDINMLPEQLERGTIKWELMLAYAYAYQAGRDSVPLKDVAF